MSTTRKEESGKKIVLSKVSIRTIFIVLMLLIQIAAITSLIILSYVYDVRWLNVVYFIAEILSIVVAIPIIINSRMDPSYKITWLAFMVINSILGVTFYWLFANKKFNHKEKAFNAPILDSLKTTMNDDKSNGVSAKLSPKDGDIYNFATYIRERSFTDTYINTKTTYFAWGEEAFPVMLKKLKAANHYIFMEYFIIQPGKFWDAILEVLILKAKSGIDVRVMYDDLGSISTLPPEYDKYLRKQGIKCYKYCPLRPLVNIRMNNRDHRKIMVIDGHTGFTGGINIADEYINEINRFGKWKDNAIMLEGDGVFGLTNLFLTNWSRVANIPGRINFDKYLTVKYAHEAPRFEKANGYVSVYGSIPFTYETVGLNIYTMMCYRAKEYIDIATPYLILNSEMENAICQAAKNGVRVRILAPYHPDKKTVFELTRANYKRLLKAGVHIYEYTPGFVHAKMFVVDGIMATVGTINLDYRSLFLHSENGCFLYRTDSIKDIQKDFDNTFKVSKEVLEEEYKQTKVSKKIFRVILKIFAPLM